MLGHVFISSVFERVSDTIHYMRASTSRHAVKPDRTTVSGSCVSWHCGVWRKLVPRAPGVLARVVALHQREDLSRVTYKRPHAWVLQQVEAYISPKPRIHTPTRRCRLDFVRVLAATCCSLCCQTRDSQAKCHRLGLSREQYLFFILDACSVMSPKL